MDDYLLYAVEAQAVEDMALLHEQAARLHDQAARIQDATTRDMTARGEAAGAVLSVELAARARDLAAVERARADQVWARHAEMIAGVGSAS